MSDRNPLQQLGERGQSVWLDFISRELVTTGELERFMAEDNVTGLTSNPTIFQKAVALGTDYDEQLRTLTRAGMSSPDDLFFEIAISDIRRAADALRPVYESTGGRDGFVSIEVVPAVAHDTEATVEMARMYWERVERPNLMVKVPATPEGIPAIRQLIASGININVTLIFALSAYRLVADAYIKGLEERRGRGGSLDVSSVASFFVSRIDTAVDRLIEEKLAETEDAEQAQELRSLLGTAAIANARLAYEAFEELFHGDRFEELREGGASSQRPLWASTSAKNPAYRDVVYAEALIGPETVDTMPPETITAFRDHGIVAGDTARQDYAGAHRIFARLAAAGIDMDQVTQDVLAAGVKSFADSYDQLIQSIAEKADRFRGGLAGRQHLELGPTTEVVRSALAGEAADVARRIWERDPTLWKPGDEQHAAVIANRLGWLDVVGTMRERVGELIGLADSVRDEGVRDVLLLGMGGSSLCPEVLRTSFGSAGGYPVLHVIDTTDPRFIADATSRIDPRRSLFIVSSKSGGTVETLSHMEHFWSVVRGAGVPDPGKAFVAITDPGTSLAETARGRGFRHVFENPPDIGGRYSALSYFGLVPAALSGIDVAALLERAEHMAEQCAASTPAYLNVGLALGTALGLLAAGGVDKVTILAPPRIAAFSLWAEQLIAESTGKEGRGLIPIGAEPIGPPGVYDDDRVFVALRHGDDADFDARVGAIKNDGQPVITLELADLYDLGGEFFRWEFATAVAGSHLRIDPFDEPNVQESKDNTKRLLDVYSSSGELPAPGDPTATRGDLSLWGGEPAKDPRDGLRAFLETASRGDYIALMAYVTPTEDNESALQELRAAIRDARRNATTLGFGPRFLHSTGQLHKGGPPTGVYVQITADDTVDVEIPGRPFTFSVLERAQAQGDLQSLHDHGRRAVRIHIGGDLRAGLRSLTDAVIATAGAAH